MTFREALVEAYCRNPCQVLPNALWKTLLDLDGYDTEHACESGFVTHLEAWDGDKLIVFWNRDRQAVETR